MISQRRLHRKRLVHKLLIKVFLDIMNENHSHSLVVKLRSASTPRHLQDVRNVKVHIALGFAIEELGALDNDEMGGEVDAPGQGCGGDQDLDLVG